VCFNVKELTIHCRAYLATYKVPAEIHVVRELPRSHVGKVDKARLAAMLSGS
jgi:acyl-CoA synthetase (AMP-forming)/AMP-acid ligase II